MTWPKGPNHDRSDARCDQNGSMPNLRESHSQQKFTSANSIALQVISVSPFYSGHSRDSHVRYDLSHSTSPVALLQAIRVRITLKSLMFVCRMSHDYTNASTILLYIVEVPIGDGGNQRMDGGEDNRGSHMDQNLPSSSTEDKLHVLMLIR